MQTGQYITDGTVTWIVTDIRDNCPVGGVQLLYALPAGYVKFNGATVLRADYPRLVKYATDNNLWDDNNEGLYGTGDGATTFRLPNLIGRFFEPNPTSGIVKDAGLPNITGQLTNATGVSAGAAGAFKISGTGTAVFGDGNYLFTHVNFDASKSSSVYGNSDTVQPKSITLIPCGKY